MGWNYQRDESTGFAPLPAGDYRIRIQKAEMQKSQKGNDMLFLQFEVSGDKRKLFHRITFLPDNPGITNRNLTRFFDSFKGIAEGNFNTASWAGQVGACHTKIGQWNGSDRAEVDYFIAADKQATLPAWVEPENGSNAVMGAGATDQPNVNVPAGGFELPPFG